MSGDRVDAGDGRLVAAALVDELVQRAAAQAAALSAQQADLAHCACATWQSRAALGYRDRLLSAQSTLTGVAAQVDELRRHLAALAADLRHGRAGDLVDAQDRLADAVVRGYATPGVVP
ncbi:hypothetical protein [Tersicoccus solisilvae]|nr:hypothetical protein [Tersicoccus solisilvae]